MMTKLLWWRDAWFMRRAEGVSSGGTGLATPSSSRLVSDITTRVLHGLMALSFAIAYVSAESERWQLWHLAMGYLFLGATLARVVWGLWGPRHAHAGQWRLRVQAAGRWLVKASKPQQWTWSHWSSMALMALYVTVALLLLAVLPLTLSGVVSYEEWGPWWLVDGASALHEAFGEAMLALVLGHIAAVLAHGWLKRTPHWQRMFSGRLPGRGPDVSGGLAGVWAVLSVAASVVFVVQVVSGNWLA